MATKKESTHQLIHRNLTLYQREHSAVWQCRYKVDSKWIRATTKETQLDLAVNKAKELLVEAEIRKRSGIPVVTKRFKDIAMLAIDRMERDLKGGLGKSIYKDYIRIINEYFIPSLGQRLLPILTTTPYSSNTMTVRPSMAWCYPIAIVKPKMPHLIESLMRPLSGVT